MPAIASTIFKIRAHSDFLAPASAKDMLSFRKGQPFYALATDFEKGIFFVSTQFAVPFSRTAVTGMVPIEHFNKVDLFSKDPPITKPSVKAARPVAEKRIAVESTPVPGMQVTNGTSVLPKKAPVKTVTSLKPTARPESTNVDFPQRRASLQQDWSSVAYMPVMSVKVLSVTNTGNSESVCLQVSRSKCEHVVHRSLNDLSAMFEATRASMPRDKRIDFPLSQDRSTAVSKLENYLNIFVNHVLMNQENLYLVTTRDTFFKPSSEEEFQSVKVLLRRDSGLSQEEENTSGSVLISPIQKPKRKLSTFSKWTSMMFGH